MSRIMILFLRTFTFHKSQVRDGSMHQTVFTRRLQTIFANKPVSLLIHPYRKQNIVTILPAESRKAEKVKLQNFIQKCDFKGEGLMLGDLINPVD